jgi:hypothetical protein
MVRQSSRRKDGTEASMRGDHDRDLAELLSAASLAVANPSPGQHRLLDRLHALLQRLETERFQLAVLGQFKRGKSSLLNALLGRSLLPVAITPLTAVPTFVRHAPTPSLILTSTSGQQETKKITNIEELAQLLAGAVTETEGQARERCRALGRELPALENYLKQFLVGEKRSIFRAAVARKACNIVSELKIEVDLHLKALLLPVEELDAKLATFEKAIARFEREQQNLRDLLAGDWARTLEFLERTCDLLHEKVKRDPQSTLAVLVTDAPTIDEARTIVEKSMDAYFDRELSCVTSQIRERLGETIKGHEALSQAIIDLVRTTAADLMEIPIANKPFEEPFQPEGEPYWVASGHVDTFQSLTADSLSIFLPASVRDKRARRRLLDGIERAFTRNVADLQWAMHQNVNETFRRLGPLFDERFDASLVATRGVMSLAMDRKRERSASLQLDISRASHCSAKLKAIEQALSRIFSS